MVLKMIILNEQNNQNQRKKYAFFVFILFVIIYAKSQIDYDCNYKQKKLPENKKKTQLGIDNQILEIVTKTELMKEYLTSYFTIVPGQPPHAIKF